MKKKLLVTLSYLTVLAMLFSACGKTDKNVTEEVADLGSYPLQTNVELSYWCELNANVSATATDMSQTKFAQKLMEETGVKVKYIHPAMGQAAEAFSLMIASNELPDIIEYSWANAKGGPAGAISDGTIIPLNDSIKDYAPNLTAFLKENPDIDKSIKTDEGQYYVFPFVRSDKSLLISNGPVIRADWLSDIGMEPPEVIEEWEEMLTRFKDQKGATAPFTIVKNELRSLFLLFSSTNEFYIDNGKVKYGPAEPEYRNALEGINRWFNNGLLDKNYVSVDRTIQDANILTGKSGATFGSGGSGIGKWLDTMKGKDDTFDLVAAKYPGAAKEDTTKLLPFTLPYAPYGCAAITTACKNVPVAAKFLDYSYSEEGALLNNFGIEGESFNYVDGEPIYSEFITNNPDGLTMSQAMAVYFRANYNGPFIQDKRYIEQYYAYPQQKDALNTWLIGFEESYNSMMPSVTFTMDESSEYSNIFNEIEKYRDTMTASLISGIEPLSKYDEFLENLKKLKLDRAIEIRQAAYDRFIKR